MKVTKQYCDVCGKEISFENVIDVIPRINTGTLEADWKEFNSKPYREHPFGRNTVDGAWEIELCDDCLKVAISKLLEMKKVSK